MNNGNNQWLDIQDPEPEDILAVAEETDPEEPLDKSVLPDNIRLYLNEIGQVDRLTPEQEIELAQVMEKPKLLRLQLAQETDPAKASRIQRKIERAEQRAKAARQQFISANLRLVAHFAYWYLERGTPFLDLVQEGNLGLIRAVEKYDWRTGFRFSTYANWWIQQALRRATHTQERAIRLPVHANDEISAIVRSERELAQELERLPTEAELSERTGLGGQRIAHLRAITRPMAGLGEQVNRVAGGESGEGEITLADTIGDESHDQEIESIEVADLKMALLDAIKKLTIREGLIVFLRNGLVGGQELTLAQAGEEIGVSREMARQIEIKAMNKLKANPQLHYFHFGKASEKPQEQ